MLQLTEEQRVRVEENMGLVGKVIQDCVHTLDKGCIYDYDDLFQIGCIGLCKAAQTDQPENKGAFSTYTFFRLLLSTIAVEMNIWWIMQIVCWQCMTMTALFAAELV